MEILAAAFAALAVFIIAFLASRPRQMPEEMEVRLQRLERGVEMDRNEVLALPFGTRVTSPIGRKIRGVAGALLPQRVVQGADHRLMLAGRPMSTSKFFSFQALMVGLASFAGLMTILGDASGYFLAASLLGSGLLVLVPFYWLRIKVAARRRALARALPDAVDLMVTTVEAGMGIDGALSAVGNETEGPLGDELRLAVRETTLGRSRREALLRLVDRTQVPELTSFIRALVQAEQTGIPIGQVLRIQAAEMRLKRRQAAEAQAQKAPVKMIIVLLFFILPALLMFVMAPAMMRMRDVV